MHIPGDAPDNEGVQEGSVGEVEWQEGLAGGCVSGQENEEPRGAPGTHPTLNPNPVTHFGLCAQKSSSPGVQREFIIYLYNFHNDIYKETT